MRPSKDSDSLTPLQAELRDAMAGWGCPLCELGLKAESAFIDSLNYERVLDLKTRDALKASRGLCHHHSQVWRDVQGSALGIAIVYRVSILDLLRDTDPSGTQSTGLFRRKRGATAVAEALSASQSCPACTVGQDTARRFSAVLIQDVPGEDFQARLVACGGLCLPHLREVLTLPGADRVCDQLIRCHRLVWEQLMGELEEFIRKNDYRFSEERMTPSESTSWTRALGLLTGDDCTGERS